MQRPTRLWFVERARAWLLQAQGHARQPNEESLADELEKLWELGVANSLEALDGALTLEAPEAEGALRALLQRPTNPKTGS